MQRKISPVHSFDVSNDEAKRIQEEYRGRIVFEDTVNFDETRIFGGADVAFLHGVFSFADNSPDYHEAHVGIADKKGVNLRDKRPQPPDLTLLRQWCL